MFEKKKKNKQWKCTIFCHFAANSALQILFEQFWWFLFVNGFQNLWRLWWINKCIYVESQWHCMDSFAFDATLNMSFRLNFFSSRSRTTVEKKINSSSIEHNWKRKTMSCFIRKWGKKGYWEKRFRLFFCYLFGFILKTRTHIIYIHSFSLTLEILFSSVFQRVPLILTRRRCDRSHSHLKHDLPINFHRFRNSNKAKETQNSYSLEIVRLNFEWK